MHAKTYLSLSFSPSLSLCMSESQTWFPLPKVISLMISIDQIWMSVNQGFECRICFAEVFQGRVGVVWRVARPLSPRVDCRRFDLDFFHGCCRFCCCGGDGGCKEDRIIRIQMFFSAVGGLRDRSFNRQFRVLIDSQGLHRDSISRCHGLVAWSQLLHT